MIAATNLPVDKPWRVRTDQQPQRFSNTKTAPTAAPPTRAPPTRQPNTHNNGHNPSGRTFPVGLFAGHGLHLRQLPLRQLPRRHDLREPGGGG